MTILADHEIAALCRTRTTETAVLEDAARLKAYQAEGWQVVTYEAWRQACQAACERTYARLMSEAGCAAPRSPERVTMRCPECRSSRIGRANGVWYCRSCRHEWGER